MPVLAGSQDPSPMQAGVVLFAQCRGSGLAQVGGPRPSVLGEFGHRYELAVLPCVRRWQLEEVRHRPEAGSHLPRDPREVAGIGTPSCSRGSALLWGGMLVVGRVGGRGTNPSPIPSLISPSG